MTSRLFSLLLPFLLFLTVSINSSAQGVPLSPQQIPVPGRPPQQESPYPEDEAHRKIERDMAKKANEERQAALKRDTDKLLKLSTELKAYVDKSNENMLSMNVIKKAEEIEKLAHSVKEKMKGN